VLEFLKLTLAKRYPDGPYQDKKLCQTPYSLDRLGIFNEIVEYILAKWSLHSMGTRITQPGVCMIFTYYI
jgi:hypothetical protein